MVITIVIFRLQKHIEFDYTAIHDFFAIRYQVRSYNNRENPNKLFSISFQCTSKK